MGPARRVACRRDLLTKAQRGEPQQLRFEAQLLSLGDQAGLLALTHEVFSAYQLWAEQALGVPHLLVAAYTNGCESYVPTAEALAQGGYEGAGFPYDGAALRYRYRVPLRPEAEQQIREAILSLRRDRQ